MNSLPLGQLRFTGNSIDGNPTRYFKHVSDTVAVMRVDPAMHDIVALQIFRSGLAGSAARWFEDIEADTEDKPWSKIQESFKEKFRNGDPAVESALIAEAHGFGRLVIRMNDGEKDRRLQERVRDRLYTDQKWGKSVAGDRLTCNDVHDMITILTSKRMDKLENGQYQNYNARPTNNRPPMNPTTQTTNTNPRTAVRAEGMELWWCFKCGDWGHRGYNCSLGKNVDQGMYDRRQQEWFANRDAMKQNRMEEVARSSSVPAAKTMNHDTIYRWTQKGLTKVDSTSDLPPEGINELRLAVARAARRDGPKEPKQRIPSRKPGRVKKQKDPVRPTDENILGELEVQAREELQRERTEYQPPRVDEDMEDVEQMLPVRDTMVVAPPTNEMSEMEFQRLLPRLRPHLEKMGEPSQELSRENTRERRPRHVLEKIRATEEYNLPTFELGQHPRDTPITLSVLQLLQIAPSVRQQLSRLMQCRKEIRGNRAKEMVTSPVMPFQELMTVDMREDLEDSLARQDTE
ncbi:Ribonuclease H [Fusarium albosuccineum]|uniref:Ribonuclease H n=1 Tax=Fusarium albosuccineum TaxID=1237068 RepID=A0A8H4LDW6_9HYPO|nr:Ribonuclease H [Fusarium albosuccineum]